MKSGRNLAGTVNLSYADEERVDEKGKWFPQTHLLICGPVRTRSRLCSASPISAPDLVHHVATPECLGSVNGNMSSCCHRMTTGSAEIMRKKGEKSSVINNYIILKSCTVQTLEKKTVGDDLGRPYLKGITF